MKVYEIIDARSERRRNYVKLKEARRKGLLIRRARFGISVTRSLWRNPINGHSSLKVTARLLVLEKRRDPSAFYYIIYLFLKTTEATPDETPSIQSPAGFFIFYETRINSKLVFEFLRS